MGGDAYLHSGLTRSVIGGFCEAYTQLGYGFLEHVYVKAPERELRARGHAMGREVAVRVRCKGEEIAVRRLDMIVDGVLILEVEATAVLHESPTRQVCALTPAAIAVLHKYPATATRPFGAIDVTYLDQVNLAGRYTLHLQVERLP